MAPTLDTMNPCFNIFSAIWRMHSQAISWCHAMQIIAFLWILSTSRTHGYALRSCVFECSQCPLYELESSPQMDWKIEIFLTDSLLSFGDRLQ